MFDLSIQRKRAWGLVKIDQDIGREEFIKIVNEWIDDKKQIIKNIQKLNEQWLIAS